MISERHEQLIQDVLEGDASPAQKTELDRLIESDAAVRERHAEMRGVFTMLAENRGAEFPASLHAGIMSAISTEQSREIAAPRRQWRLVPTMGAFLAGAAAATLIVVSVMRGPTGGLGARSEATSGTLAPAQPIVGTPISSGILHTAQGNLVASTLIADDAASAGGTIVLKLESPASGCDVVIDYPSSLITLTGIRAGRLDRLAETTTNPGRVALRVTTTRELTFSRVGETDAEIRVSTPGAETVTLHTLLKSAE